MRLFVWEDFAPDYSSGLACAVAETVQEAQMLIVNELGYSPVDWGSASEYPLTKPVAFATSGGM